MRNSNLIIQPLEGVLIYADESTREKTQNPSLTLISELVMHFNIPRKDEEQNLTDQLAFYCVCYLALFKELKGPPVRKWIDEQLCDVYLNNGMYPLEQCLEKYAEMKAQEGTNDDSK